MALWAGSSGGLALALALIGAEAAHAETPAPPPGWAQAAADDLNEIHTLIRDNHPGPVDPENPGYRIWLEQGFGEAMQMARAAGTQADYARAIRFYLNGFRDGHMGWGLTGDPGFQWPGFLTATPEGGPTTVAVADPDSPVPVGARLVACDGVPADRLLAERVHRYRTNADIPQQKPENAPRLFYTLADDRQLLASCRFTVDGADRSVALTWRPVSEERLNAALETARGTTVPPMGVRQVDGVWFVSIPTFSADAKDMTGLLDAIRANVQALHDAPLVVIDVRGNGGGNSEWGSKAAGLLWSEQMVSALENSFDWTTDWRASRLNIELTRRVATRATNPNLQEDETERLAMADGMQRALDKGQVFFRNAEPPTSKGLPAGAASPFRGKVYLLTDSACASACLDFADVVTRLPGVVHVGLPTSADAIYIDVVGKTLNNGQSRFSWSLKVYRNRVRGNNQWYEPRIRWPGGTMTDSALAAWVKTL